MASSFINSTLQIAVKPKHKQFSWLVSDIEYQFVHHDASFDNKTFNQMSDNKVGYVYKFISHQKLYFGSADLWREICRATINKDIHGPTHINLN